MTNHFESSRFTMIIVITIAAFILFAVAAAVHKDIAIALAGPMFIALGVLWGTIGGSKIAEHGTKHLRKPDGS